MQSNQNERVVSSYYAPKCRTLMHLMFIVNALFSFTVLIGNSVWATNNTLYNYSSMYGFSWFICIVSLLLSAVYIIVNYISDHYHVLDNFAKNVMMCGVSFVVSVFWFIAAIGVVILARDCSNYKNAYWYVYYYGDTKDHMNTCSGIIVSATFSFLTWGAWLIILGGYLMTLVTLYKKEKNNNEDLIPPENVNTDNHKEETPKSKQMEETKNVTVNEVNEVTVHEEEVIDSNAGGNVGGSNEDIIDSYNSVDGDVRVDSGIDMG